MARLWVRILPESITSNMALKLALDVNRAISREQVCYPQVHLSKLLFNITSYFVCFLSMKSSKDNTEPMRVFEQHMWCCIPE